jgi:hypothetical protein
LTTVAPSFGAAEQLVKPGDRVALGHFVNVCVDLLRGRDVRMAEDDLSVPRRYCKLLKQRRGGVPQCVNADTADAVVIADAGEGPDEVARLDRPSRLGGEDQACVGPRRAEMFAVALLSLAAVGQRMSSQPEKREIPASVVAALADPERTPEQNHQGWYDRLTADGWQHGTVKDEAAKTHPDLVPFDQLPEHEKQKDRLFMAIVQALAPEDGEG